VTQFAFHLNPGRDSQIPFVLQVQSSRLERMVGRVVIPLISVCPKSPPDFALTPRLTLMGILVYANPLAMATISRALLREAVGMLSEPDQDRIVRAIDEMISRA